MFLLKIYLFYFISECVWRVLSTEFNIMLTMLLLDMISKFLAPICIKVSIGTL